MSEKPDVRLTIMISREQLNWLRKQTYLGDARSVSETVRKIIAAAMAAEEENKNDKGNRE